MENIKVVFIEGGDILVSTEDYEKILSLKDNEEITIQGKTFKLIDIADMYPFGSNQKVSGEMESYDKKRYLKAMDSMLKGLRIYISNCRADGREPSKWSLELDKKLVEKIDGIKLLPEDYKFNQPDVRGIAQEAMFGDRS